MSYTSDGMFDKAMEQELECQNRCIVRLKTSTWNDKKGLHYKKSLTFLKKQCKGFNFLEEDIDNIGSDEVVKRIINVNDCEDGVYEIITFNEKKDFETGNIEDYNYKLLPFDRDFFEKNMTKSHPLKWKDLKERVQESGMENPDILIEDIRRCGPCQPEKVYHYDFDDQDAIEASICTIFDKKNNRIVICHHY